MNEYTFGTVFSGEELTGLAFEAAGHRMKWQVEIDDSCNEILGLRWPDAIRVRDVRDAGRRNLHYVDIVIGTFPCQDISSAGKGAGIRPGTRSGLWFELERIIGELRPRVVFLENSPAITSRDGTVVLAGLTNLGYDARWGVISAADAGASHLRKRWFLVAYANGQRKPQPQGCESEIRRRISDGSQEVAHSDSGRQQQCNAKVRSVSIADKGSYGVAHANSARRQLPHTRLRHALPHRNRHSEAEERGRNKFESRIGVHGGTMGCITDRTSENGNGGGGSLKDEPRLGGTVDGLSRWMDRSYDYLAVAGPGEPQHAWEHPRVTTRMDHRTDRVRAIGNAVVPQVVYPLAVAIREWLAIQDAAGACECADAVSVREAA